ncbi:hypothetical protein R3P38DRAFT_3079510, partial [Favolaschia claudopus]
ALTIRLRLGDLIDACPLPVLRGISAFGTKLCFYSITKDGLISPEYIPAASPLYVTDTARVGRWNHDILAAEGEAEFRRIVQAIITECAQLSQCHDLDPISGPTLVPTLFQLAVQLEKLKTYLNGSTLNDRRDEIS